jgi:hypothetical protein
MFNDICTVPCTERDTADDDLTVLTAFVFRPNPSMGYGQHQWSIGNFSVKFSSSKGKKGNSFVDMSFLILNFFFFFKMP